MDRVSRMTRRSLLGAAGAAAALTIVPRRVLGGPGRTAPSDRLNIAGIGVGGQGAGDIGAVSGGNNIVALCDVDEQRAAQSFKRFAQARRYADFRKMFDEMDKSIDAVVVATPDHTHAVAALAAIRRGKHVYCEKPLAHSVAEVRELMTAARRHNVVTQLGNQGHSFPTCRAFCEWIWDGAIGKVHTVHAACSAVNSGLDRLPAVRKERPAVPEGLDWDLWLGPSPSKLHYHPAYVPGHWRGWVPFGNGTIGDWLCHVVDPVFWALDLGAPASIVAEADDWDPKTQGEVYPKGDHVTFEFAAKADHGPVTLHWYSGTRRMPRPADLEPSRKPVDIGAVVIGEKGSIMYGSHGAGGVRLIPETKMRAYKQPPQKLPRVRGHHADWLEAIRKGSKAGSDFAAYGGPLTELAMLGVIAIRFPGQKLIWDAANMRFGNFSDADALVNPPYRAGWKL